MTTKDIINKYDLLYQSGTEFTFRVGLCNRNEVEGASDTEIQEFSDRHNITIPPAIWSYTRHFGKKARVRDSEYNCAYSLADYDYALHQASLREEWHGMMDVKELLEHNNFRVNYDDDYPSDDDDGVYTPDISSLMNIEDAFIFHYDEFTRAFKFANGKEENPHIYYLTRYYTLTSLFSSFTNRYRDILFMFIVNFAPHDFAETRIIDGKRKPVSKAPEIDYSDGFECIGTYQEMFKNKKINRSNLKSLRDKFYYLNNKIEEQENKILSFIEFENNFIEFLHKNDFKY